MTIGELIEELKECPKDVPVCLGSLANQYDGIDVIWQVEHGRVVAVVLG